MIYGNQWDEVMSWLISTGAKKEAEVNEDSSTWGNYSDSKGEASIGSGTIQISGYNEAWQANNIYDLAGNCFEYTTETGGGSSNPCIKRGAYYNHPYLRTSSRSGDVPTFAYTHTSFRPLLYL